MKRKDLLVIIVLASQFFSISSLRAQGGSGTSTASVVVPAASDSTSTSSATVHSSSSSILVLDDSEHADVLQASQQLRPAVHPHKAIVEHMKQFMGRDVEDFVANLPAEYRKNFVLFTSKQGSHHASPDNPRVMLFDDDLQTILTFTAQPTGDHSGTIEIFNTQEDMTVTPITVAPKERHLDYNSFSCFGCHGASLNSPSSLPIPHMVVSYTSRQMVMTDEAVFLKPDNKLKLTRLESIVGSLDPGVYATSSSNYQKFIQKAVEKNSLAFIDYLKKHNSFPIIHSILEGFFRYPQCGGRMAEFFTDDSREQAKIASNWKRLHNPLVMLFDLLDKVGFSKGEIKRFLLISQSQFDLYATDKFSIFAEAFTRDDRSLTLIYKDKIAPLDLNDSGDPCDQLISISRKNINIFLKSNIKSFSTGSKSPSVSGQCNDTPFRTKEEDFN